jgi:hypothetical protein
MIVRRRQVIPPYPAVGYTGQDSREINFLAPWFGGAALRAITFGQLVPGGLMCNGVVILNDDGYPDVRCVVKAATT